MSKINDALVLAHRKGYRVNDEGAVVNALGRERKCQKRRRNGDVRYVFNVAIGGGKRMPIPPHKLQAYQKFGDAMFEIGVVVRHLDGNALNNRPENIDIGTVRDNIMDRAPEDRKSHSKKAIAAKSDLIKNWDRIELDHREHRMGFKLLARKYGVSKGALSNHFNKMDGWKPIQQYDFDWTAVKAYVLSTDCNYIQAAAHFGCSDKSIRRQLGKRCDLK